MSMFTLYLWIKTLHVVFVIAWMAAVFYLPRIVINIVEVDFSAEITPRLILMGRRLYRFGHIMFGIAFALGLILWLGYLFFPNFPSVGSQVGWMHAKLAVVALIFAHYICSGRWLKKAERGQPLPSGRMLRWYNEIPVFGLLVAVWLVISKPIF